MAQTLSNGFIKPEDGDRGDALFDFLEANTQRMNDHTHNGSNSEPVSIEAVVPVSQTITAPADWGSVQPDGTYKAIVTAAGGISYTDYNMTFRDSDGKTYYLDTEVISADDFFVICNDNTLDITIIYN